MADELPEQIPYPALGDLVKWLEVEHVPYTVIGGLAVSLVSQPRPTVDVDLVVWLDSERWSAFLDSAEQYGMEARTADALAFARKRRVLLIQHKDSGIGIDISFGALPFELEMIDRSERVACGNVILPVATAEDVIIMKIIAHREQDMRDVENIMRVHPHLDFERVKYWVHQFAEVLEMPELDTEMLGLIEAHQTELTTRR